MTISQEEQEARSNLRMTKILQAYLPLPVMRWLLRQSLSRFQWPASVEQRSVVANGVPCEWVIPPGAPQGKALLYLHGGGFVYGLTPPHLEMVAYLAKQSGLRTLVADYRLAPEYPYPAALQDCLSVYSWLRQNGVAAEDIVVAGDSAGGNLAIAMTMSLRDGQLDLPAAVACLSPVVDLADRAASFERIDDPLLHPRAVRYYTQSYIGDGDHEDPLVSPILGDFRGFPPLLLHAGEGEILRDDAVGIEASARRAGVDVTLMIYPRMWHVWQLSLSLPQAMHSLNDIAVFLRRHMQGS